MAQTAVRRRQEERTDLSDRLMAAAAIELLVEVGVAGTTLAAIGQRAGYSRGLVTHRFGSKAGLFAHVHDTVAEMWLTRVNKEVGNRVGMPALKRAIDALYRFIIEAPNELRAMYLLRHASIDPGAEYRANVAKVHKAQTRDACRWIEAGQKAGNIDAKVNAKLAAEVFCAAADGLLYRWLVDSSVPVKAMHDLLARVIDSALSAE